MTDWHTSWHTPSTPAAAPAPAQPAAAQPAFAQPAASESAPAQPAPAQPAPAPAPVAAESSNQADDSDNFDRDRVLRLLDQLEHDITAVEAAMVHAESGDQEAFAAAVATLEPQLTD